MGVTQVISGHGTQLKRGDGASPEVFTTIDGIEDIEGPKLSRGKHPATHQGSGGWKEIILGLLEGEAFTIPLQWKPGDTQHDGLLSDFTTGALRSFQLEFPDAEETIWEFSAYVTNFSPTAPVDGKRMASVEISPTGAVVV